MNREELKTEIEEYILAFGEPGDVIEMVANAVDKLVLAVWKMPEDDDALQGAKYSKPALARKLHNINRSTLRQAREQFSQAGWG